jgi:hypothetical protein
MYRLRRAASILLGGERNSSVRSPIPPLSEAELAEAKIFFPMAKYFIMGHSRSGTTLLARLIRLHPQVHCNWQAHFFTQPPFLTSLVSTVEIEGRLAHRSNLWNHGRDLSPVALRAVSDFILERDARRHGKQIVGDKSPTSTVHGDSIRRMHAVYPDASVIYILRDGRDVLVSERFRNLLEERELTAEDRRIRQSLRGDPGRLLDGTLSIFTRAFICDYARRWADDLKEVPTEGSRLYGNRFISLRYEDLLQRCFEEMRRLWEFLGIVVAEKLADVVEAERSANPDVIWQEQRDSHMAPALPKGQPGIWRHLFRENDRKLFKEIAGDMLVKWGYETDLDW